MRDVRVFSVFTLESTYSTNRKGKPLVVQDFVDLAAFIDDRIYFFPVGLGRFRSGQLCFCYLHKFFSRFGHSAFIQ